MNNRGLSIALFLLGAMPGGRGPSEAVTIYTDGFETPVGPEWSSAIAPLTVSTTPIGERTFLEARVS